MENEPHRYQDQRLTVIGSTVSGHLVGDRAPWKNLHQMRSLLHRRSLAVLPHSRHAHAVQLQLARPPKQTGKQVRKVV